MAVVFTENFDTGSDGTAVTSTNTAYDNVVLNGSGTVEFDSAQSAAGGLSCLATSTGTGDSASCQDDFTATSLRHRRYYFRIPSAPPDNATPVNVVNSGGIAAQLQITTGRLVRIRDGFVTEDTAATALTVDTWHRVEWKIDAGAGTQEARLFYGSNRHGTTPDETLTGVYTGGDFTGFRDALPANPGGAWSLWIDEVEDDDAAFPGPVDIAGRELFSETFDLLADGTAVSATNTAFTADGGDGTREADSAFSVTGGVSCAFICATTSENVFLGTTFTATGERYFGWYFRPGGDLDASTQPVIAQIESGSTIRAQMQIQSGSTIGIKNEVTLAAETTNSVTLDAWHRLEWGVVNGGNQTLRLFLPGNIHGDTPDEEISAAYSEGTFDNFDLGPVAAADAWTHHVDAVRGDGAGFPGPVVGPGEAFREDFEGVGDAENVTELNTWFDEILVASPHTLVGDTSWSVTGTVSARFDFNGTGDSANCKVTDHFARESIQRYVRWYTRFNSVPGRFERIYTAEDNVENVNNSILTFDSDNRIVLANGQNAASARQFAAGDEVRIEVFIDPVGDQQVCRLYYTDIHAATDLYDEELITALGSGIPDDLEVGSFNNQTWSMNVDSVVHRTDRWVGPEGGGIVVAVGAATDVDAAQPAAAARTVAVSPALEVDDARLVTTGTVAVVGPATDADVARAVTPTRTVALGRAFIGDAAPALAVSRTVVLGVAAADDVATPVTVLLGSGRIVGLDPVIEVDLATVVTVIRSPRAPRLPRRRTRWQFVLGSANGGHEVSLTHARDRRLTFRLAPNSEASFRIDGRHPQAAAIGELSTDLHVLWTSEAGSTQTLYRGRVGATGDDIDADAHTVDVSSLDYRSVLERRILWPDSTLSWTQVEQAQIAWELIQQTQQRTGGDLGISRGIGQTTGRVRDRTYEAGDAIGERIQELSDVIDGFDWDITPVGQSGLHFDVFYPQRGFDQGVVLEYGGLAQTVRREVDPSDYANAVFVTGDENADTPPTPEQREVDDLASRREGRWDKVFPWSSIIKQDTLDERADWQIDVADIIAPTYTVVLRSGGWSGPGHIWVGDTVRVVVKSGRLKVDTRLRVTEIQIDVPDTGQETVTLTLAAPSPSPFVPRSTSGAKVSRSGGPARRLGGGAFRLSWRDIGRRLTNLERR